MTYSTPPDGLASVDDVATDLMRPLSPVEVSACGLWITQLSSLIRVRYPDVDRRVAVEPGMREVAARAVIAAIARKLSNPEGKLQESVDDYAYRRADAVADGSLYISDSDWASLAPVTTGKRSRGVRFVAYGDYR